MRSQSYGDKQREAQRRKKQEELWKKANPEAAPVAENPNADTDKKGPAPGKARRKKPTPDRPSA